MTNEHCVGKQSHDLAVQEDKSKTEIVRTCPDESDLFEGDFRQGVVCFEASIPGGEGEQRGILTITVRTHEGDSETIASEPLFFGADKRRYAVIFALPEGTSEPVFTLTKISVPVAVFSRRIVTARVTLTYTSPTEYLTTPTSFGPLWRQNGSTLSVTWLGDTYTAAMPAGFDLMEVPSEHVALAEELLFGEIERVVFGQSRKLYEVIRATSPEEFELGAPSKVLLCYSAGEDSTAALELLPSEKTVGYYSERSYDNYFTPKGAKISLHATYEKSLLGRIPGVVRVPNDFELIGISVGMRLGYQDSFGYAAIAALLADHLGCNVIAFGSVMEQIFMKSGYNYSDVVNYRSARLVAYRSMFRNAGLYFSVPTGALSEVLTHQVVKNNQHGYVAVPCPSTSPEGEPCGTCFKCFRKMRLDEGASAPDPSPSVVKLLMGRPMKSATSVVAAAQIAGETRFGLDEYSDVDVSFLHKYHGEGLKGLVPEDLRDDLQAALHDRGIEPMNLDDEFRLRTVANIFCSGGFSKAHAFPGVQAERFARYLADFD